MHLSETSPIILNLGCGTRTSSQCVNIDWSMYLRLKSIPGGSAIARAVLPPDRVQTLRNLPSTVKCYNLAKGIPYPDQSVDAIYHSHVLEHIARHATIGFVNEIWRVLKVGGIHRIIVPDLEYLARQYLGELTDSHCNLIAAPSHEESIAAMLEQCVRVESAGTASRPRLWRFLENTLLGDARKRGETHQWMYDRITLSALLARSGFRSITVVDYLTSSIPHWDTFGLDNNKDGSEYKPRSLYVEATK